jgi:hypothetical protein
LKHSNDDRPKRIRKPKTPTSTGKMSANSEAGLKQPSVRVEGDIAHNEHNVNELPEELLAEVNESTLKTPSSEKKQKISSGGNKNTYISMVHDAIVFLKERSGSSVQAITKYMLSKNEYLSNLPSQQLSRFILAAIKTGVRTGRFLKIKCSYKVNAAWVKKEKADAQKKKERDKKRKKTPIAVKQKPLDESLMESDHVELDRLLTEEEREERTRQVCSCAF